MTTPFVDVTAAKMLGELERDLSRGGVRLLVARDVGQVRDVLRQAEPDGPAGYPTVDEAVAAAAVPAEDAPAADPGP